MLAQRDARVVARLRGRADEADLVARAGRQAVQLREGVRRQGEAGVEDAQDEVDEGVGFADEGGQDGAVGLQHRWGGQRRRAAEDVVFGGLVD